MRIEANKPTSLPPEGEVYLEFHAFWAQRDICLQVACIDVKLDLLTEGIHTIALALTCIAERCNKGESVKIYS